jgi:predicted PurR-regulated permease PerM
MSPRWSDATKFWVITLGTLLAGLVLYRLRHLIPLVGLAIILAYVLNPLVNLMTLRGRLTRTLATGVIYLGFLALIVVVPALFVPSLLEQARAIDRTLVQNVVQNLIAYFQSYSQQATLNILGLVIDLRPLYDQIIQNLEQLSSSLVSQTIRFLLGFASGFASTLVGLLLILVLSFYMVKDAQLIVGYLEALIPEAYREEMVGLAREIDQVWRDFFRGQLLLGAVVGIITGIGLAILGVPNALLLGIVAGVLEFIPNIGPTIAAIPAILIAFFQGSAHLALSNFWFAVVVALLYVVIQLVENNVLVPRIIGGSVHLHPVVVLIGVFAGASVAGILGIFLAAPTIASARIIGRYVYYKLLDRPAGVVHPPEEPAEEELETAAGDGEPSTVVSEQ